MKRKNHSQLGPKKIVNAYVFTKKKKKMAIVAPSSAYLHQFGIPAVRVKQA
jgi:hypothetical protein